MTPQSQKKLPQLYAPEGPRINSTGAYFEKRKPFRRPIAMPAQTSATPLASVILCCALITD
jgi:hypothetical protein